jgi:hypothetical protein
MAARIVTYAHHYKRPPRKKQAAPLASPAVVTRRIGKSNAGQAAVTTPPPANDDRKPVEATKPAIVTTASRKRTKLERARCREERPEDPEADAVMQAWLERAKWGRGPAGGSP